jgi:hypothetical protein
MKRFTVITAAAIGALLATSAGALAKDVNCASSLSGTINGNVKVPANMTCTLTDIAVTGNVTVARNAFLTVSGGTISGNVQGENCFIVNLFADPAGDPLVVGGNVQIGNCTGPSGASVARGPVTIDGNFHCHNNTAPCTADGVTIGGNVQVTNNEFNEADFGFANNVSNNTISGNLQCEGNDPAPFPYDGGNTVAGNKLGQCSAALGF